MNPKGNQNETNNHPKTGFLRFVSVLEEDVFQGFWKQKKSAQNPEDSVIRYSEACASLVPHAERRLDTGTRDSEACASHVPVAERRQHTDIRDSEACASHVPVADQRQDTGGMRLALPTGRTMKKTPSHTSDDCSKQTDDTAKYLQSLAITMNIAHMYRLGEALGRADVPSIPFSVTIPVVLLRVSPDPVSLPRSLELGNVRIGLA